MKKKKENRFLEDNRTLKRDKCWASRPIRGSWTSIQVFDDGEISMGTTIFEEDPRIQINEFLTMDYNGDIIRERVFCYRSDINKIADMDSGWF